MKQIDFDNHSLRWLMHAAYVYSWRLFSDENGVSRDVNVKSLVSEDDFNGITAWMDGLTHKMIRNVMDGRCSLSTTMNFDMGKFEERVVADLKRYMAIMDEQGWEHPELMTEEELAAEYADEEGDGAGGADYHERVCMKTTRSTEYEMD